MVRDPLTALFEPRRVALVGACEQPGRIGELLWRNLIGFPGEVLPVSRSAETVFGRRAYRSLRDVDGEVDLAVVAVPARAVPGVIADAGAAGVPVALVISGGFAETGPAGVALQQDLLREARSGGVRIVGPNCFGVQNCDLPLNASIAGGTPTGGGGIALVTQSGAYGMAIHAVGLDEWARFAKICATGNKADIADAELLRYLGADAACRTLCFFCESLPDGRGFVETAAALTPHKPVIVARTGRSPAGARAAASHTAALASSDRIWRGALEWAGVIQARSGLELLDVARALDAQPIPTGPRVAIITNSGGTGVELADFLADEGLDVPELSRTLQDELRAVLPAYASPVNPVDMTPVWSRYGELYPLLVERLARSGEVDVVIPVLLQRSASDEAAVLGVRDAVARLRADAIEVAVYVCWVTARSARGDADTLARAGIPCFDWPERTARAAGHAVRYGRSRVRPRALVAPPRRPPGLPPLPNGMLDAPTAARLLIAAGVPVVDSTSCASPAAAVVAADRCGYPVVAKVQSFSLTHKSDVGGVRLGLVDARAVAGAAGDLLALAADAQVLVQPQVAGVEVVVGGLRDPQFGPMVMVGLGGVLVEVTADVAFAPAPLDRSGAHRLLAGLRGHAVLEGFRGAAAVDRDSLARIVQIVGELVVAMPEIAELDLNPVLVTASGSTVVDWRVRIDFLPAQDQ